MTEDELEDFTLEYNINDCQDYNNVEEVSRMVIEDYQEDEED